MSDWVESRRWESNERIRAAADGNAFGELMLRAWDKSKYM